MVGFGLSLSFSLDPSFLCFCLVEMDHRSMLMGKEAEGEPFWVSLHAEFWGFHSMSMDDRKQTSRSSPKSRPPGPVYTWWTWDSGLFTNMVACGSVDAGVTLGAQGSSSFPSPQSPHPLHIAEPWSFFLLLVQASQLKSSLVTYYLHRGLGT